VTAPTPCTLERPPAAPDRHHRLGKPFRLGFFTHAAHRPGQRPAELYAQLVDTVVAAEELGYQSAWVGQHHFGLGNGSLPSPLILMAHLAARTKTIHLGTAVTTLPLEDPIRLAEDAAVLDSLSGGRIHLGLGSAGGDRTSFPAFGRAHADRRETYARNLSVLHRLLDGGVVGAPENPVGLFPPAPGLRERLWQAASSVERARKAARDGDGLMIGSLHDRPAEDQLPRVLAYLDEWEAAQGPGRAPRIAAMRFAYWGRDKEDVLRRVGPELARRQAASGAVDPLLPGLSPRAYLERLACFGSPGDVTAGFLADPALLGYVTDFLPSVGLYPAAGDGTPGADLDIARLERFARDIAPALGWGAA